ncbi:MAG: histidine phosphatase family protein [Dehalococcoidia bacterium]|nr:histidine phosphatase family protein [Dehalococcoidia bacterium]
MRLILVRHGQSEGNANGVIQGHLDFGLTELGRRQAAATARRLAGEPIERVLSSPLARALSTAEPIAEAHGVEIEPEHGLLEYAIGEIAGLRPEEIADRFPHIPEAYGRGERPIFPGEEGRETFYERIRAVMTAWSAEPKITVAVAHGGVISALCYMVTGLDHARPGAFAVANCGITELVLDRFGKPVIRHQNDTCHLRGIVTMEDPG